MPRQLDGDVVFIPDKVWREKEREAVIDTLSFPLRLWEVLGGKEEGEAILQVTADQFGKAFKQAYKEEEELKRKSKLPVVKDKWTGEIIDEPKWNDSASVKREICKLLAWKYSYKDIIKKIKESYGLELPIGTLCSIPRTQWGKSQIAKFRKSLIGPAVKQIMGAFPAERVRRIESIIDTLNNSTDESSKNIDPAVRVGLLLKAIELQSKEAKPLQGFLELPEDGDIPEKDKIAAILKVAIKFMANPQIYKSLAGGDLEALILDRAAIIQKRRGIKSGDIKTAKTVTDE